MEYGLKGVNYRREVTNRDLHSIKEYIYYDKNVSDGKCLNTLFLLLFEYCQQYFVQVSANLSFKSWWPTSTSDSEWMKKIIDPGIGLLGIFLNLKEPFFPLNIESPNS